MTRLLMRRGAPGPAACARPGLPVWHGLRAIALTAALAGGLAAAGCKSAGGDITGSIGGTAAPLPAAPDKLQAFSDDWAKRYEADPQNRNAAVTYARALRAQGRTAQAVAVLQGAAIKYPSDFEVLGAYGKALADAGRLKEAAETLSRAHTPEKPNWSILSAQGAVADQMGDHETAQGYYEAALKLAPGDPTVLSNLGLSYALSKQLPRAEETLRRAAAHPEADSRVRQNFALVLALQGKFPEAEEISRRDLAPAEAAANVASIRSMIAQSNTWRDIQAPAARRGKQAMK